MIPFPQWKHNKMSDSWIHSHSYQFSPLNFFLGSFYRYFCLTNTSKVPSLAMPPTSGGKLFRIYDRLSRPTEFLLSLPRFTTLDDHKITVFYVKILPLPHPPHSPLILLYPLPITCTLPGKRSLGICPVAHVILFVSHSRRPVAELFGSLV